MHILFFVFLVLTAHIIQQLLLDEITARKDQVIKTS